MLIVFAYKGGIAKTTLRKEVMKRYNRIVECPIDVRLFYDDGIPYLSEGKHISITHTSTSQGERIELIAISDSEVGIDIEKASRDINMDIAKRYFKDDEIEYVSGDRERLLKVWTMKEAYGKSCKVGMYLGSVMNIEGFKYCDIYEGYLVTLYTTEDDIFFVAI